MILFLVSAAVMTMAIRWYKIEVIDHVKKEREDKEQEEANKHFIDELLQQ